jgi:hypothetical protein
LMAAFFMFSACWAVLPSGANATPRVTSACEDSNLLSSCLCPRMSLTKRDPGESAID